MSRVYVCLEDGFERFNSIGALRDRACQWSLGGCILLQLVLAPGSLIEAPSILWQNHLGAMQG